VRAFYQALEELEAEGGIPARHSRYSENLRILVAGMARLGLQPLIDPALQSPIITAFISPDHEKWQFKSFYEALKASGFVIYPGKVTDHDTFRIGNIGDVHPEDMHRLVDAVARTMEPAG
jgi:2-aminoethylphosphonate-pyruvate transaminase